MGENKTMSEIEKHNGWRHGTIYERLKAGWTPQDAVNRPPKQVLRR